VEREVLGAGCSFLEVNMLHLDKPGLYRLEVGLPGTLGSECAGLRFEAAPDLERLQQRIALRDDRQRQVDRIRADRPLEKRPAAFSDPDDAKRELVADHLADRRAADPKRLHELALTRELLTWP
jgi:hypothetical protein